MNSFCRAPNERQACQPSNLTMLTSAAATASTAPNRSVLLIGHDRPDDEQRAGLTVLARDWDLLPKLGEKPCKRTSPPTTPMAPSAPKMACKLASFNGLARLPFTQEITGSNPVGGISDLPAKCAVLSSRTTVVCAGSSAGNGRGQPSGVSSPLLASTSRGSRAAEGLQAPTAVGTGRPPGATPRRLIGHDAPREHARPS
jgi:hypothetical protein